MLCEVDSPSVLVRMRLVDRRLWRCGPTWGLVTHGGDDAQRAAAFAVVAVPQVPRGVGDSASRHPSAAETRCPRA